MKLFGLAMMQDLHNYRVLVHYLYQFYFHFKTFITLKQFIKLEYSITGILKKDTRTLFKSYVSYLKNM